MGHTGNELFDFNEASSEDKDGFRIASININGLVSSYSTQDKLHQWIEANRIDIICIQEWYLHNNDNRPDFPAAKFSGYTLAKTNDKTAVLYKNSLSVFPHKSIGSQKHGQSTTWISVYSEKKVIHVCSYYQSPAPQHEQYFDQNLQRVLDEQKAVFKLNNKRFDIQHAIFLGDFNAKSIQWTNKDNKKGDILVDWIGSNHFTCINDGSPTHINKSTSSQSAIDLAIISDNTLPLIKSWEVDNEPFRNGYSDHYYIKLKINFDAVDDDIIYKITYKFNEGQIEDYEKLLAKYLPCWHDYLELYWEDPDNLDDIVEYFQIIIKFAASKTFGVKKYCKNSKFWLNKKCKELIRHRRILKRKLFRLKKKKRNSGIAIQWRKHINHITNKLRYHKKQALFQYQHCIEKDIEQAAIGDSHVFYRLYNQATKPENGNITPLKDKEGNIIATTKEEKAKILHAHFNRKIKENEYNEEHTNNHKYVSNRVKNYSNNNNNEKSIINRPFTEQECMNSISNSKVNTAMGFDLIHQKLIYYGRNIIVPYLTQLWNLSFITHQRSPRCWKYADINPIPKPGRDTSIPKNNRPISLLPVLARQLEKALSNRLISYCIKNNLIHDWNCAFQPNKSTEDILICLSENILKSMELNSATEISFKDLQSAYDSVWHDGLIYKLKEFYNVDGNFLAWVRSYLGSRFNRVILNGHKTKWVQHDLGLPQGGPMSPILWTLYVNDFKLRHPLKNKLVAFADDMSMFSIATNLNHMSSIYLQQEIDHFYNWTLDWKLVINSVKCNSISLTNLNNFRARVYNINKDVMDCVHAPSNAPDLCIHNKLCKKAYPELKQDNNNQLVSKENITIPSAWQLKSNDVNLDKLDLGVRILGLFFDPRLDWKYHTNTVIKKSKYKLHQLRKITYCKDYNLSPKCVWKLYISTIRPMIEYGFCVYSKPGIFDKLESIQMEAMRIALRLRRPTPSYMLYELLDAKPIRKRVEEMQCKLWNHCIRADESNLKQYNFHNWINFLVSNDKCNFINFGKINNKKSNKRKKKKPVANNALYDFGTINNHNGKDEIDSDEIPSSETDESSEDVTESINPHMDKILNDLEKIANNSNNIKVSHKPNTRSGRYNTSDIINVDSKKYYKRSPMSMAYSTVRNLTPKQHQIKLLFKKQCFRAPLVYYVPFPHVFKTLSYKQCEEEREHWTQIEHALNLDVYTDGSCMPNPGPGGFACVFPSEMSLNCNEFVKHHTTINYCELKAIELCLIKIIESNIKINDFNTLSIFCDSQFVINLFKSQGYTRYMYYYQILQNIFSLIYQLKLKHKFSITFIKVSSHSGNEYNDRVDNFAKTAARRAIQYFKENEIDRYNDGEMPSLVSNSFYFSDIKQKYDKERIQLFRKLKDDMIHKRERFNQFDNKYFNCDNLFLKAMWQYDDDSILYNCGKYFKQDYRKLNKIEAEVLTKLRTEQCNLNNYEARYFDGKSNECPLCQVNETVQHYLIDCRCFRKQRRQLFIKLKNIDPFFGIRNNLTAINILFPFRWQSHPIVDKTGNKQIKVDNYELLKKNTDKRYEIYKQLLKFVLETKRFDSKHGI